MFDTLKAKILRHKLHDFDLDHPEALRVAGRFTVLVYRCRKCGRRTSLEYWQMADLPYSMKTGCE